MDLYSLDKKDEVVQGTTCFAEHNRYQINCENKTCKHWLRHSNSQNCALISAMAGPKTLQEVGEIFGLTRMRICQIEKTVLKKLSDSSELAE